MSEILDKIRNYAKEYDMLPESGLILACVSGGADSMCLLNALREISRKGGFKVGVAHYNHMLRGVESDRDEAFVMEYCVSRGVPFYSGEGDVKAYAKKHRLGIEESARNMRYGFFHEIAEKIGAERIATAHTADDNAETIILNLARGTGTCGFSGIPPVRGRIVRPLLRVTRDEVMVFVGEQGIPFAEDSTNSLDVYTRNKIRHFVIPVLKEVNPRFAEAAASAAELSRADDEYLSKQADKYIAENCGHNRVGAQELLELPFALSGRVIRKLHGGNLSLKHVKAVLEMCSRDVKPSSLSLPGATVYREYGQIVFAPEQDTDIEGFKTVFPQKGDSNIILGAGLKMSCKAVVCNDRIDGINKSFTSFLFKSVDICGRIAVRPRREGDMVKLYGRNGTKTLKKLFIDRRVPARFRKLIPVIADDEGVLAIYGLGRGTRAVPEPGDDSIQIDFEEIV